MKTIAIIVLSLVNFISGFSQENKITIYKSIYRTLDSSLEYSLILSDNNEFLIYGGGTYQWDMLYPTNAFYGTYTEHNDTLSLNYLPLDSILIDTDKGFYNKLAFYQDTIWLEKQKEYSGNLEFCIKKNNSITFSHSLTGWFPTRKNLVFTKAERPISYSFSIKGQLPSEFSQYVSTSEFSFQSTSADIYIAHYPVSMSSMDIKHIANSTLDTFPVTLTNYTDTSYVFVYSDKLFNKFAPQKIRLDSLSSCQINNIKLQYANRLEVDWKYLNKNISSHWPNPQQIENDCLAMDEYGNRVDFDKQMKKLRQKIFKKYSDISYVEAYKTLLKSDYFDKKKVSFLESDSLPSEAVTIFNMLEIFGIANLAEMYGSFYNTSDSIFKNPRIQKCAKVDNSNVPFYISKAGFTKDRTICFIQIKTRGNEGFEKNVLVFERRLSQYVLTGIIEKGTYHDELPNRKCDYFEDMRNYRLFY